MSTFTVGGRHLLTPLKLKFWARVWGPFLGAAIRVTKVTPDFKEIETRMKLHWYNSNMVGTHYGGSLYSMTDPFYMVMLLANIGDEHFVWDKSVKVEYVRAVKSEVRATFKLTDDVIERIVEEAKDGKPHYFNFEVNVLDVDDNVVTKLDKSVYVRRKPKSK